MRIARKSFPCPICHAETIGIVQNIQYTGSPSRIEETTWICEGCDRSFVYRRYTGLISEALAEMEEDDSFSAMDVVDRSNLNRARGVIPRNQEEHGDDKEQE